MTGYPAISEKIGHLSYLGAIQATLERNSRDYGKGAEKKGPHVTDKEIWEGIKCAS